MLAEVEHKNRKIIDWQTQTRHMLWCVWNSQSRSAYNDSFPHRDLIMDVDVIGGRDTFVPSRKTYEGEKSMTFVLSQYKKHCDEQTKKVK